MSFYKSAQSLQGGVTGLKAADPKMLMPAISRPSLKQLRTFELVIADGRMEISKALAIVGGKNP
jgi:hypothetical protein